MATTPEPVEHVPNEPVTVPPIDAKPERSAPRKIKSTRVGSTWTGLVIGIFVLVLLLIFILQNLQSVNVNMLFWEFSLPLGVGALLAAIAGALVMALVGGVRILQIRRAAKKM